MNTHESVSQRDALDIVFANRNRAYGAYQLRREYTTNLGKAFVVGLLTIGLLLLLPKIMAAFSALVPEEPDVDVVCNTTVINIEKPAPPPLLKTPPPSPKPAIAFKPSVVAPDNQAPDEKPADVQTILDDPRNVGGKTIDGTSEEPPSLDPPGTGLGVVETPKPNDNDEPLEGFAVNKMPSFPGGEAEMFKWIYQHVQYPAMAKEAGTQGQVVLVFVVGKDGSISDISVVKTPAGGSVLGKEASRVVQSMPKWSPGEANGHPVKVRFTLPIRFALQ